MSIYVEIVIRAPVDELWQRTQDPALHQRWDLRFTEIDYLPRTGELQPQRFDYATRIGFGLHIRGQGESTGTREASGVRTSALRFWSDDAKSLIREGSGYWQYVPTDGGVRFLTWYDYRTRFGAVGRLLDAIAFKPLMRWATAWSFDRLRLWLEEGIPPELSLQRTLIHAAVRIGLAFVFAYHGLVPKLIAHHPDELAMLRDAGVSAAMAPALLKLLGLAELLWAGTLLALWRARWPFVVTGVGMIVALVAVGVSSPRYLAAAFTPVTLNLLVALLSLIGWMVVRGLPTASRCSYHKPDVA